METSLIQAIKLAIVSTVGLSKDALHVYVGLSVFFTVVIAWRKPFHSPAPILAVLMVALAGEVLDARDDLATFGYWRWGASLHDIINTAFWPAVLCCLAGIGLLPGVARHAAMRNRVSAATVRSEEQR